MNKRLRGKQGQTIIFLGISGSGKDTQADFLLKRLGRRGLEISTGDGLRKMMKKNNAVGGFTKQVLNKGGLMPAWGPMYIWLAAFVERLKGNEHIIFTGAPRRIEEAQIMDGFMKDIGRALPVAIHLKVSASVIMRRLMRRGRSDDNKRAIAGRIAFFKKHVMKVVRYYAGNKRLITIDGNQPPEAVWRDIKKALKLR